jgi:oxygen-independent coproporphyrinogen-3 oxidase
VEPHPPDHSLSEGGELPSAAARAAARCGLYIHVPFCAVRCAYCDFSSGALSSAAVARYLEGMEREIALRAPTARDRVFDTVFFGGGTPSALSARHFGRLWATLSANFAIAAGAEITLEANPESVRAPLLEAWARAGVNRLSMGAQSFDPAELERLGRIHDAARPAQAFRLARDHGFRRLSLDLMFGFPGHSAATWFSTLEQALALAPEHVSAYCFIPEGDTPMGADVARGRTPLPSPEEQADRYAELTERTTAAGYGCYETSNFCRPGGEARHNLVYWLRRDYLALGPSAHGCWKGVRYGNHYALERWSDALERDAAPADEEPETPASRADEVVMLGLRLSGGLDPADHPSQRWAEVADRYGPAFDRGLATGRLEAAGPCLRIPPQHRFVADDVIAWLMARAERRRFDTPRSGSVPSDSACPIPPFLVASAATSPT